MKNTSYLSPFIKGVLCCGVMLMTACGYEARIDALEAERDSLSMAGELQTEELNTLSAYVADIAMSIDSIAIQEQVLLSNRDRDGYFLSRRQIRENLTYFSELIERQRERISMLEDSLAIRGESVANLKSIVSFLSEQLKEKEIEINKMRGVVTQQKRTIKKLETEAVAMQQKIDTLNQKVELQQEALVVQDQTLNEGFVRVGTKKELVQAGLLKGKFLSKKGLNENLDSSQFMAVDIREFLEMDMVARKVTILTPMPANSYRITQHANGTATLNILNPTRFWSLSNYLIIQTN
ncbi:MAG: hypothetical protein IJE69_06000 [Alistipes sp.]|nr:hypothetical protein [Alistipes sp.]